MAAWRRDPLLYARMAYAARHADYIESLWQLSESHIAIVMQEEAAALDRAFATAMYQQAALKKKPKSAAKNKKGRSKVHGGGERLSWKEMRQLVDDFDQLSDSQETQALAIVYGGVTPVDKDGYREEYELTLDDDEGTMTIAVGVAVGVVGGATHVPVHAQRKLLAYVKHALKQSDAAAAE